MIKKDYKAIVVGCSLGGKEAITTIVKNLKHNSIPIIIVQHLASDSDCYLATHLKPYTDSAIYEIINNLPIQQNGIYIAPANYHVLFGENKIFYLSVDEKHNFSRPSIDISFESASEVYMNDLVGIVLTGANSDGSVGLDFIKKNGGLTIVQDPAAAKSTFMPNAAIKMVKPDYILSLSEISFFLEHLNKNEYTPKQLKLK